MLLIGYFVLHLILGYDGYILVRHWWTHDLDWTTEQRRNYLPITLLLGPLAVFVGLALLSERLFDSDPEVLIPRRNRR